MGSYFSKGFLKLLARYRNDQSTGEEKQAMETWYESLDDSDIDTTRTSGRKEDVWLKIMDRTTPASGLDKYNYKNKRRFVYYAAAAMVLLVSGLVGYFASKGDLGFQETSLVQSAISTMHENDTDQPSQVTLPDGSKVTLDPSARISYTSAFNKLTRTVRLEGNAFFSVAKNKSVPFIVQTQLIQTKVLGTEFSIRKNASTGETEVEVITGKVEVNVVGDIAATNAKGKHHVFLTANLRATFQPEKQELVMGLIAAPHIIEEEEALPELFVFTESPLREVVNRLEKAYGVSIRVANNEMLNCPITADLSHETLPTQLDIIITALNAEFSVGETGIQIRGGGCVPAIKSTN